MEERRDKREGWKREGRFARLVKGCDDVQKLRGCFGGGRSIRCVGVGRSRGCVGVGHLGAGVLSFPEGASAAFCRVELSRPTVGDRERVCVCVCVGGGG